MISWQPMAGRHSFSGFLNKDARKWFGDKYSFLIDLGIEGFWNDMNEPAIFYSSEGVEEAKSLLVNFLGTKKARIPVWKMQGKLNDIANNPEDYRQIFITI